MGMSFGIQRRMEAGETDQRYRISITLIADQRPKYWKFHCVRCRTKLCELSGTMLTVNDTADMSVIPDFQPTPMLIECPGRYCGMWYEFISLNGRA